MSAASHCFRTCHSASAHIFLLLSSMIIPDPTKPRKGFNHGNDALPTANPILRSVNHVKVSDCDPPEAKWNPLSRHAQQGSHGATKLDDLRFLLRSLTQTCRSLRAFALPLLWAVVQLNSIDQLGRLRDTEDLA